MFFQKKMAPYPSRTYPIMQQPSLQPNEGQLAQMQRRFGMFLHFGVNTFNNTEWSDGTLPVESYCPSAIDADSWVRTAYEGDELCRPDHQAPRRLLPVGYAHHHLFRQLLPESDRRRPGSGGCLPKIWPPAGPLLFALGSARIMLRG